MKKRTVKFIVFVLNCLLLSVLHAEVTTTVIKPKRVETSAQVNFINKLAPLIQSVDNTILQQRNRLQMLYAKFQQHESLNQEDSAWLAQLATSYHIKQSNFSDNSGWLKLLNRVDSIPSSLVIAQAANESAWGTSRFAKQANNYFGEWCYSKGCGLVPKQRPEGAHYEVRSFPSIEASIKSYMMNLNANKAYAALRALREQLRAENKPLDGLILAAGLKTYSQRGEKYVVSIRNIIRRYQLG